VGFAQDVVPDEEVPPGTEPVEPEYVLQNETQTDKARRLSEASGVPEQDIIKMRLGIREEGPEDPLGEPTDEVIQEPELPQGRGWGVIAQWLGLHPSILGQGHDKDLGGATEGTDEGLLSTRRKMRSTRVRGPKHTLSASTTPQSKAFGKTKQKDIVVAQSRGKAAGKAKSLGSSKGNSGGGKANAGGRKNKGRKNKANNGKAKGKKK